MVVIAEHVDEVEKARFNHPSAYVAELRQLISYYVGWIGQAYADTPSGDDNAFTIMQSDDRIQHAMNLRSLYVAGEYTKVTSETFPECARIANRAIAYIKNFTQARKSLAYNGSLFGAAVMKKYWAKVTWPEYPNLVWTVPVKIKDVDRRRLRIERDNESRWKTRWTVWDYESDQYLVLKDRNKNPNYQAGYRIQDFCWYLFDQEEEFPFGRGLGEVLYPLAFRKKFANLYWDDLCEAFSKPHFAVELDDSAGGHLNDISGLPSAGSRTLAYLNGLEKMRARHNYVMPKGDKLKMMEAGTTGTNVIRERMNYLDDAITLVCLANELTTQSGGSSSSFALGQVHKGGENTTVLYNRLQCDEVWKEDLVGDFFYLNRDNFSYLGLPIPEPYQYRFETLVTSEELKKKILDEVESASTGMKLVQTMGG